MQSRLLRCALALSAASMLVLGVASTSSATVASRAPSLTFFFNTSSPQERTHVVTKVCWSGAERGWRVNLQEAEGWGHVWRTVQYFHTVGPEFCVHIGMSSGQRGLKPFRMQLLDGSQLRRQTPVQDLSVYGIVPGIVFFDQPHSPYLNPYWDAVVANGHVYATFGRMDSGNTTLSSAKNTCKWFTFKLLSTDSHSGDPNSGGTSTLGIEQYSINPQYVTFADNKVTTWRVRLDGSIFQLDYSNTNKYSSAYFLTVGATADCLTATGF